MKKIIVALLLACAFPAWAQVGLTDKNTITKAAGVHNFKAGTICLSGATSGCIPLNAAAIAGSTPVDFATGGTVAYGVTSAAATTSAIAVRDASANLLANNFNSGYTTIATAAGTTTLTVASPYQQFFTGVTTQTVVLPVASTLALGQSFMVMNLSTGNVTVNSSGGNAVFVVLGGSSIIVACILTSGTSAASWNVMPFNAMAVSGKMLLVNNSLILAGTDNTTMTFPTTSATVARTDASNVFVGVQNVSTPGATATQFHLNSANPYDDTGLYLTTAAAGNGFVSAGASFNGTLWVAKSTTAWTFGGGAGGITWNFDTGLTPTATFTPTARLKITTTGDVYAGIDGTATPAAHKFTVGDASRPATDTNVAGGNGTVSSGLGTGNATISSLLLQSPVAVASGSAVQTATTGLTIKNGTAITTGYTVATLPTVHVSGARAHVTDQLTACPAFAGTFTGGGAISCPAYDDGTAWVHK